MSITREHGWVRPVAVPTSLSILAGPVSGRVRLPPSVYSSGLGEKRVFDLDDEGERIVVYEMLLVEGRVEDQVRFLDARQLQELWPRLWLPPAVRAAWAPLVGPAKAGDGAHDGEPVAGLDRPPADGPDDD